MAASPSCTDHLAGLVRDALFVTVGFGVLAFQHLQVRRREWSETLTGAVGAPLGRLEDVARACERTVAATSRQLRQLLAA